MSPAREIDFGFSPCPNDTFAFDALVNRRLGRPRFRFNPMLADVEELNRRALAAELPLTKLSFQAMARVADRYWLMRAGAALGRGCGPLVVARPENRGIDLGSIVVATPGRLTTAQFMLGLHLGREPKVKPMIFSQVMESVASGRSAAGVIIHEGRFTYPQYGLVELVDLGAWWEGQTGLPIPLGCIAARRDLGEEDALAIEGLLAESVARAWADPMASREYVLAHAQEMDDEIVRQHIELYVNEFSRDLGLEGLAAVREMMRRGADSGLLPELPPGLTL